MRWPVVIGPTGKVDVKRLTIPCAQEALWGKKIVFASDIHVDRLFSDCALEELFRRICALEPDFFLLGGDYANDAAGEKRFFDALKNFGPHCPTVLAVGNNDKESLPVRVLSEMAKDAGGMLLVNRAVSLPVGDAFLTVGAADEEKYGQPDAEGLFAEKEKEFRVFISHYPVVPETSVRADIHFAGHTHGGQFRVFGLTPFSIRFEGGYPLIVGEGEIAGNRAYVSPGVGMSKLPARIGVFPSILLAELTKK